jgi:DnaJ-domain-containing protein 1
MAGRNLDYDSRKVKKSAILAEIRLVDGSILWGNLFASAQGRITDLLNDDRKFLPIETAEGKFVAIAKSAIHTVSLQSSQPPAYEGSDPWRILGVGEGASADELKQVYRQLCRVHHPDRIRGLGLGPDYQKLATLNMARINDAYTQLMKSSSAETGAYDEAPV